MKKLLCLLLTLLICFSFVACTSTNNETTTTTEETTPKEPELDIQQELINICCEYSNCKSIRGFEIGTQEKTRLSTDNGYHILAKGSYWPVDEYGNIKDLMTFDIELEATWDGSSKFYDIERISKVIRKKY